MPQVIYNGRMAKPGFWAPRFYFGDIFALLHTITRYYGQLWTLTSGTGTKFYILSQVGVAIYQRHKELYRRRRDKI